MRGCRLCVWPQAVRGRRLCVASVCVWPQAVRVRRLCVSVGCAWPQAVHVRKHGHEDCTGVPRTGSVASHSAHRMLFLSVAGGCCHTIRVTIALCIVVTRRQEPGRARCTTLLTLDSINLTSARHLPRVRHRTSSVDEHCWLFTQVPHQTTNSLKERSGACSLCILSPPHQNDRGP